MCNTIANIYIPSIHKSWTRSKISDIFIREGYGEIIRIDFVRTVTKLLENDTRTFDERTNPTFHQAFIRLDVSNAIAKNSPFLDMQPGMQIRVYPTRLTRGGQTNNMSTRFITNRGNEEYWMCLAATKPLVDSTRTIAEIIAQLNDLLPLLETKEDEEIFAYLHKTGRLLFAPPTNYDDYCEMNRHQFDNNVQILSKRIAEREIAEKM